MVWGSFGAIALLLLSHIVCALLASRTASHSHFSHSSCVALDLYFRADLSSGSCSVSRLSLTQALACLFVCLCVSHYMSVCHYFLSDPSSCRSACSTFCLSSFCMSLCMLCMCSCAASRPYVSRHGRIRSQYRWFQSQARARCQVRVMHSHSSNRTPASISRTSVQCSDTHMRNCSVLS